MLKAHNWTKIKLSNEQYKRNRTTIEILAIGMNLLET